MIGDATLNRFFAFHVIAVPLVLLGLVAAHILALHEVGSNNPDGVEIKKNKDANGIPLDGIPFHPYYTVKDIVGVVVFLMVFSVDRVLRARRRRLLPRIQQLRPGRSAEDAAAYRAGVVLHAVLLDPARHGLATVRLDAKFWGVVAMGASVVISRLPALAGSQPGQVDPLSRPDLQDAADRCS